MRGFISSNNCWLYDRYILEFPQKWVYEPKMWPPGPPDMFVGVCYDLNSHLTIVISTTNHRQASCELNYGRIMGPHIAVTIGFINQLIFIAAMGMMGLDAKAVGSHGSHRSQIIHGLMGDELLVIPRPSKTERSEMRIFFKTWGDRA